MEDFPRRRQDLSAVWVQAGAGLSLRDPCTNHRYILTQRAGRFLLFLDGTSDPAEFEAFSADKRYRLLLQFQKMGWLEGPDSVVSAPGLCLRMIPCGETLRRGCRCPLLLLYNALLRLWPLALLACLIACSAPGALRLPFHQTPVQNLLCLLLCQIPAIAMHELAHAAAANASGLPVDAFGIGINLGVPCLCTVIQLVPFAPLQIQRSVYKAGPLSNLCIGCIALTLCLRVRWLCSEILFWAAVVNLLLAVINLLPFVMLDGCKILKTFPALRRAMSGSRAPSAGPLESSVSCGYRFLQQVGFPVFLTYQAICLIQTVVELIL